MVADAGQLDMLDGFEAVDRTPNVTPPSIDTATRPLTIRGGTVKVKRGTASIKVSCPAISPGNCTGSLTVRTAKRVKLAGLNVALQLGRARYDLAPGASKSLKVGLAKGSSRLADRKGRLAVLATASTGPQGKIAQSSRRISSRSARPRQEARCLLSPGTGAASPLMPRRGRGPQRFEADGGQPLIDPTEPGHRVACVGESGRPRRPRWPRPGRVRIRSVRWSRSRSLGCGRRIRVGVQRMFDRVMLGAARPLPEAHQGVRLEAAVWRDRGGVRHDYPTR